MGVEGRSQNLIEIPLPTIHGGIIIMHEHMEVSYICKYERDNHSADNLGFSLVLIDLRYLIFMSLSNWTRSLRLSGCL